MTIRIYRNSDRDSVITLWNEVFPNPAPHNGGARFTDKEYAA